jgi:NAD(P)-dependent dehydrogenase (short-subunit alcohol dehydrogenase family)
MDLQPIPRTALVTGAGRRIGRAIAADLANHGWAVAIHYRTARAEADSLATDIRRKGGRAATVCGDLADLESPARILDDARDALGPIGLLINSASLFIDDRFGALDGEDVERQVRVNLVAPMLLMDAFARQVPADTAGLVVNMIDQRVMKPTPAHVTYQVSKSALLAATISAAQGLAPRIRVMGIGPGPTLKNETQSPADFAAQVAAIPLQRGPDLSEIGALIRLMVASPSLTGQMICLDGGQHLAWATPDVIGVGEGL